ncbi:hypothetical protein ACIPIC_02425 [Streptomyces collinus]
MKVYTLTVRVESDDDLTAEQIREELYMAGGDVPFGFDITSIEEE